MKSRYIPLPILLCFALLPAVQTAVSVWMEWYPQITYPAMKGFMVFLPLIAWKILARSRAEIFTEIGLRKTNLVPGISAGLLMASLIVGFCLLSGIHTAVNPQSLTEKLQKLNVMEYYWLLAVVISLGNALFEEYYWRGFLIGEFSGQCTNRLVVCILGGLFFGIHHVFATLWIGNYLLTAAAVAVTVTAGGFWTWLRMRGISVIDCYVSHFIADLAIFYIGYRILQEALS